MYSIRLYFFRQKRDQTEDFAQNFYRPSKILTQVENYWESSIRLLAKVLLTVYNDVNAFYSECAFLSRELCSVIFVA
jgi:hypothetical protein